MRLLLDESLSARIAALLSPQGHDVAHVGDFDLLGAPDDVVLATAAREHRILVTADTDFGHSALGVPNHARLRPTEVRLSGLARFRKQQRGGWVRTV